MKSFWAKNKEKILTEEYINDDKNRVDFSGRLTGNGNYRAIHSIRWLTFHFIEQSRGQYFGQQNERIPIKMRAASRQWKIYTIRRTICLSLSEKSNPKMWFHDE